LTAHVPARQVGRFNDLVRRSLPILRSQPGLVYVKLARRLDDDGSEEVILFQEWRDVESLYAWIGRDIHRPHVFGSDPVDYAEVRVTHFESLDVEPGWFDQPLPEVTFVETSIVELPEGATG
jgi:hypothetical protein